MALNLDNFRKAEELILSEARPLNMAQWVCQMQNNVTPGEPFVGCGTPACLAGTIYLYVHPTATVDDVDLQALNFSARWLGMSDALPEYRNPREELAYEAECATVGEKPAWQQSAAALFAWGRPGERFWLGLDAGDTPLDAYWREQILMQLVADVLRHTYTHGELPLIAAQADVHHRRGLVLI